nr:hypothetical protein PsAHV6-002 [Psittacid alphaherpesvirus 6]
MPRLLLVWLGLCDRYDFIWRREYLSSGFCLSCILVLFASALLYPCDTFCRSCISTSLAHHHYYYPIILLLRKKFTRGLIAIPAIC